jgi:hypothetical protein
MTRSRAIYDFFDEHGCDLVEFFDILLTEDRIPLYLRRKSWHILMNLRRGHDLLQALQIVANVSDYSNSVDNIRRQLEFFIRQFWNITPQSSEKSALDELERKTNSNDAHINNK